MSDILNKDIFELSNLIKNKSLSPVDIFKQYSKRIAEHENKISSFIDIYNTWEDEAKIAENQISNGNWIGPLHGIPVSVKDLVDVKNKITTIGSTIFKNNIATSDADVITALKKAGAIIIGKTHMVEFAFGPHGINSNSNQTRNPWNLEYIPGGSSSGSAAAVASSFESSTCAFTRVAAVAPKSILSCAAS